MKNWDSNDWFNFYLCGILLIYIAIMITWIAVMVAEL